MYVITYMLYELNKQVEKRTRGPCHGSKSGGTRDTSARAPGSMASAAWACVTWPRCARRPNTSSTSSTWRCIHSCFTAQSSGTDTESGKYTTLNSIPHFIGIYPTSSTDCRMFSRAYLNFQFKLKDICSIFTSQ